MTTAIAVPETTGKLSNEELGGFTRRTDELKRRLNEGTLCYDWVMDELQRVIEGRSDASTSRFKTWKTIKLGTMKPKEEDVENPPSIADLFRSALQEGGYRIGDWGNDILGKPAFTAATEETEVELVNVSVGELGFKSGATRADIYKRAQELGLQLCPAEVGPQLRLQYPDQPYGEWLLIGMEPITDSVGVLNVFSVERDGYGRWLLGYYGHPGIFWIAGYRWVFLRRK